MLDPRRLGVLREFAAQGTIAKVAEVLAFTPSAVSQQLSQLQREAGVPLLVKVGRRLELTDAGRLLVDRADELLARSEQIEAELAAQSAEVRGTIRVAAFQTAALSLVAPALDRLADAHPTLAVQLFEAEAEESLPLLARGGVDISIAEEYDHSPRPRLPNLHRDYLDPDEMLLALPLQHAAAKTGKPVPLAALRDCAWATARAGTAYADMFGRICRSVGGFEPDIRHRANDMRLLLELVARHHVAAIVPALGQPERDERVATVRIAERPFSRAIFIATRESDRSRPSTAAVVAAIRHH